MLLKSLKQTIPSRWKEQYWSHQLRRRVARREFASDKSVLGLAAARRLWASDYWPMHIARISIPEYRSPVYFRPRTSDISVIRQVLKHKEYEIVSSLDDIHLIVDCGANIGCTSLYLLNAYPDAHAVVIEPDEYNMALCRLNLAHFSNRVHFIEAGVWCDDSHLKVTRGQYRDGQPWSFQVQPCEQNELSGLQGTTLNAILAQSGFQRIDLLKMDIEGSEKQVFSSPDLSWLSRTRNIAVELHDIECKSAFDNAMKTFDCIRKESGELTVCCGIEPVSC